MTEKPKVEILYEDQGAKGRYVARVEGKDEAGELIVSRISEVLISADRTFVPESLRGTGAASALVERLIADARAGGWRIRPVCPFVRAQAQRHPEWSDVIQE